VNHAAKYLRLAWLTVVILAMGFCAMRPALAISVNGAVVDLAPTQVGGELNLQEQLPFFEAALAAPDPTAGLVELMARLPTDANRRAAVAWIIAHSRRPAIDATAGLYALVRSGLSDPPVILQAALFAQSHGVRATDLYKWAAAAGLA
jgi:hypothetical protein